MTAQSAGALFGATSKGRIARLVLLALVVLAASIRMFMEFRGAPTHAVLDPEAIVAGRSLAPNQYRVLAPLLTAAIRPLVGDAVAADDIVQLASIMACNAIFVAVLLRETASIELSCVGLVALYGAAANTMSWRNRDTFLDVAFTLAAFALVVRPQPRWGLFAVLSVLAAMNRETWAFALIAALVSRVVAAGGVRRLSRSDVLGLVAAFAAAGATFVAIRGYLGLKPYHTGLFRFGTNLSNLAPWLEPELVLTHGPWALGSGLGLAYVLSLSRGARHHVPFIVGFVLPTLLVSFFIASWFEPRIFTAIYPLLLIALLSAARPRLETPGEKLEK